MVKAVIFDWDGTLADTRDAVVASMEFVLKKYGKCPWEITKNKYRDPTKSLKDNFVNFFGDLADSAYRDYLCYYQKHEIGKIMPVKGAVDFLYFCQNKNIDLFIVSNKEKLLLDQEVRACFPDICFRQILGNKGAIRNKPWPEPVWKILENVKYEIAPENVWFVGDSKQDTDCAYNANVQPILLKGGNFWDEKYIRQNITSNPKLLLFDSFDDILRFAQVQIS